MPRINSSAGHFSILILSIILHCVMISSDFNFIRSCKIFKDLNFDFMNLRRIVNVEMTLLVSQLEPVLYLLHPLIASKLINLRIVLAIMHQFLEMIKIKVFKESNRLHLNYTSPHFTFHLQRSFQRDKCPLKINLLIARF